MTMIPLPVNGKLAQDEIVSNNTKERKKSKSYHRMVSFQRKLPANEQCLNSQEATVQLSSFSIKVPRRLESVNFTEFAPERKLRLDISKTSQIPRESIKLKRGSSEPPTNSKNVEASTKLPRILLPSKHQKPNDSIVDIVVNAIDDNDDCKASIARLINVEPSMLESYLEKSEFMIKAENNSEKDCEDQSPPYRIMMLSSQGLTADWPAKTGEQAEQDSHHHTPTSLVPGNRSYSFAVMQSRN